MVVASQTQTHTGAVWSLQVNRVNRDEVELQVKRNEKIAYTISYINLGWFRRYTIFDYTPSKIGAVEPEASVQRKVIVELGNDEVTGTRCNIVINDAICIRASRNFRVRFLNYVFRDIGNSAKYDVFYLWRTMQWLEDIVRKYQDAMEALNKLGIRNVEHLKAIEEALFA